MKISKLVVLLVVVVLTCMLLVYQSNRENFYNVAPTEDIDPEYYNINIDPWDYYYRSKDGYSYNYLRVGDNYGVDMNCNNVTAEDILVWLRDNNPHLLYQYVYRYDPSINVYNPYHAPRVLKLLLRELPTQHPFLQIIRKCFPRQVRIA